MDTEKRDTLETEEMETGSENPIDEKDCSKDEKKDTVCSKDEEKDTKPSEGPKLLDLAFGMDCTGSMGSYISSAQQGIRSIVEEIVAKEAADIRLALVEYRDHPPQDSSFVTREHDFTKSVREMKKWLDECSASGGGDGPEAVADALHQLLKLSWREDATKVVVFISDAPPHGLNPYGDGFPNGCPAGLDPMVIVRQMAEKGITLYQVGCEPAILPYKEFFTGLAHMTGGQYVPLKNANLLAPVIIGGAREEMFLQSLMEQVNREVQQEVENAAPGELSHQELSRRVHSKVKGMQTKKLRHGGQSLEQASKTSKAFSRCPDMASSNLMFQQSAPAPPPSAPRFARMSGMSAPARKRSSKSSGLFGSLKNWAMGSPMSDAPAAYGGAAAAGTSVDSISRLETTPMPAGALPPQAMESAPAMDEDRFSLDSEGSVDEDQAYRMVQKSLMQNKYRDRVHSESDSD